MHKVPVGGSISHAYQFLLQNLTVVLGTAWLPALMYAVGLFQFFQHMHGWMPVEKHDLASVVLTCCTLLGVWAFTLVIRSVIGISLTQEALGVRKDFTLAHFVIGPRELRLFFAYVRYQLLVLVLYVAVVAICVGAMYAAQHYGAGVAPKVKPGGFSLAVLAAALLTMVLFVWFALAVLRLFFPLAAVASAEHRARLTRAWSITRGSTLRILLVCFGTFLPLAIAAAVGLYFLIGPDEWAHAIAAMQAQKPGAPLPLAPFYAEHAFVFAAAAGVMTVLGGALFAGAAAHAYRAVTGHELLELEDDAALVAPLQEPEAPAPIVVPVPVTEDLPPAVPHDHGDHGLSEEASSHDDHGGHHAEPAVAEAPHHNEHHHDHGQGDHGHGHDAQAHAGADSEAVAEGGNHHAEAGHHDVDGHGPAADETPLPEHDNHGRGGPAEEDRAAA